MAVRDRAFLAWAKEQGGQCCLCWRLTGDRRPAAELHHFGDKGMGQKGSDHLVARLCLTHHHEVQGKRRLAFLRGQVHGGGLEALAALQEDALELLSGWVAHLQRRTP